MEELLNLNRSELLSKLLDEHIRITQIISIAMALGVVMFFFVLMIVYNQNNVDGTVYNNNSGIAVTMLYVLLFMAVIVYSIFNFLPKIFFTPKQMKEKLNQPVLYSQGIQAKDSVIKLLILHRIQMIIRLAMLEGVALFGAVSLFLSITDGSIYTNSSLWLFLLPAVIMILYIIRNFPSRQKIAEQIESNILEPIRSNR